MKELSTEEKAKCYDEAIERARIWKDKSGMPKDKQNILDDIFPELKESDDERIRKEIIDIIDSYDVYHLKATGLPSRIPEYIAWLEKQGEQKSAWSEEDEITKNNISHIIRQYDKISKRENQPCWYVGDCLLWMQNIKDRVQPQSKQEWSEEDEEHVNSLLKRLEGLCRNEFATTRFAISEDEDWLKSIRPQNWTKEDKERYISCLQRLGTGNPEQPETINSKWFKEHVYPQSHWKPSDEQIKVCKEVYADILSAEGFDLGTVNSELNRLEEELKKLMEE